MTITRYRKRPVEVDTIQWTGNNEAELIEFTDHRFETTRPEERAEKPDITAVVFDELHDTWVGVKTGQHIVRGVQGEYYPIAEDVLAETYERVNDSLAATEVDLPPGFGTVVPCIAPRPFESSARAADEAAKTVRVLSALHQSADDTVTRVITLHEQWVAAGPPPLGAPLARWWDARLAELHDAIQPPVREQRERPTHPDGTPYRFHEIKAEGWEHCDSCRLWGQGWTAGTPHQCTNDRIQPADQTTEK